MSAVSLKQKHHKQGNKISIFDESEVLQETIKTYAKEIPKSPIKHRLNQSKKQRTSTSSNFINNSFENTILSRLQIQQSDRYIRYEDIQTKQNVLTQINRLLSNTKEVYNKTIKNRRKCQCDINLNQDETCSNAYSWLKLTQKSFDVKKMQEAYENLQNHPEMQDINKVQIDKDIQRTFPNSDIFTEGSAISNQLKNILYTLSVYDIQIGYCQGMNYIAGIMLYHAEEYIAFWLTCTLFELLEIRDVFLPGFPGLQKHMQIIDILMWQQVPYLHQIFTENEINIEDICQSWIFSLCGIMIPLNQSTVFIDCLLKQGMVFFYKFVITYILYFEDEIVKQEDRGDVILLLNSHNYRVNIQGINQIQWDLLAKAASNIQIQKNFVDKICEFYEEMSQNM